MQSDLEVALLRSSDGGNDVATIRIGRGVTILVGPNGAGKTRALRQIKSTIESVVRPLDKYVRLLAAGRSAPLERWRSAWNQPGHYEQSTAYVGQASYRSQWFEIESITGDLLELSQRSDLRLKVQARLQTYLSRAIEFAWSQHGLEISLAPLDGSRPYSVGTEASGIVQLVPLMAAIYNDRIGALIIDEPEISLHPQYQAFIRDELKSVSGDPRTEPGKKFVVIATHSPTMLSVRNLQDLPNLVVFSSDMAKPRQLDKDAPELKNKKLESLVSRLSSTHRLAFFAKNALLVEGPSDEIILEQLATCLSHPLLAANTQVVPVNGKGEFVQAVKLFELLGKRVTALADLDALSDGTSLVNHFGQRTEAKEAAEAAGHSDLVAFDRSVRNDLARTIAGSWDLIEPLVGKHPYWAACRADLRDEAAKRRATLATLLSGGVTELDRLAPNAGFLGLFSRYNALIELLAKAGCFLLSRGTIESYFSSDGGMGSKPDAAALEAADFPNIPRMQLEATYSEAVRALRHAAQVPPVDEDVMLRERLGAILGAVFQTISTTTTSEKLDARARALLGDDASLFSLENISTNERLAVRVHLRSPLFTRSTFPFDVSATENLNALLRAKLPGIPPTTPDAV